VTRTAPTWSLSWVASTKQNSRSPAVYMWADKWYCIRATWAGMKRFGFFRILRAWGHGPTQHRVQLCKCELVWEQTTNFSFHVLLVYHSVIYHKMPYKQLNWKESVTVPITALHVRQNNLSLHISASRVYSWGHPMLIVIKTQVGFQGLWIRYYQDIKLKNKKRELGSNYQFACHEGIPGDWKH
jgi:hypothetical protein